MTTRKSSAGLALLMLFLIALPSAAFADDTELFTTSANPNVLLMLDTTGSMTAAASGTSVGDLDGDGDDNTRMDILWRVVYTLLNADLSQPSYVTNDTVTVTCLLNNARRWSSPYAIETNITSGRTYQYVEAYNCAVSPSSVSNDPWNLLPGSTTSGGTVRIGSGGQSENMTYATRSSGAPDRFYFTSGKSFSRTYNHNSLISFSYSVSGSALYPENYPTNHTEAMSADFLNNLSAGDDNTLLARLGLMTFTTNSSGTTNQINIRNQILSTAPNSPPFTPSYQDIWSSVRQYAYASGGTPTAQALHNAQAFFSTAYSSSQVCRPNFAVMITDGEDTKGGVSGAPTGNGYGPDYYCGGSFNPNGWSCGLNTGQVARHNAVIQEAANLFSSNPSVKLFTVGVGISDTTPDKNVQREVLRRAAEQGNAQASNAQYTAIGASGDNTSRGAGRAFFATDADSLSYALRVAFHQMSLGTYSFTAPTVASVRMTDRNYVYKASFAPASPPATFWNGSLQAGTLNTDNTITWLWDADNVLKGTGVSSRRIYTSDNTWTRQEFTTTYITPAMLAVDNNSARDNVVNYVRGAGHDNNAKLGDIFHSKPVVVGPPSPFYFDEGYSTGGANSFVNLKAQRKRVVYVGTNDGMLHAFLSGTYASGSYDAGTGEELFGYVPYNLLENLSDFLPGDLTTHRYYVDSSPRVADVWIDTNSNGTKENSEWHTVLISGFRKGGYGYFALDVTDPPAGTDYTNYPKVLWEYTNSANVGQSWSEPFIGKVKVTDGSTVRDRWVAIFGGGVGTGNVGRSLVVLDIATGHALKTFTSTDGINNVIPASPTAVLDANGYIKFVYVADLTGSVYKFNLWNAATVSSFSVSPSSPPTVTGTQWTVNRIFQPASGGQPVYHRVEPGAISETSRYLFFGTGNQESPISDGGTGKFYAIMDTDSSTSLIQESVSGTLANLTGNLGTGAASPTVNGWYVNLASIVNSTANTADTNTHAAEKVLSDPVVFYNNVYFTTFTPNPADPCNGGGIARVYGINMYNATAGLASIAGYGVKPSGSKVGYYVYSGNPEGGIPSSPSLSIYPSGQSSIFIGFSTGAIKEIKIDSPLHTKSIKSWKEIF
jgi:Tfp pilus tip-associated adhesin PilY1